MKTVRPTSIPILMYHKVGQPIVGREDTFLNVRADAFRRQIGFFARRGFRARPFAEIVDALRCHHTLPRRTLAITFDDGYRSVSEVAAPILAEFGYTATVFVATAFVGTSNAWDRVNARPELPLMDWNELRALAATGWKIGGHTHSHPHLNQLRDEAACAEIEQGKAEIEARIGMEALTFSYPFGHFNAHTPLLVRRLGFEGACTTRSGLVTLHADPYLLPRVKVAYRDGLCGMLYRLWLRPHLPEARRRHRRKQSLR